MLLETPWMKLLHEWAPEMLQENILDCHRIVARMFLKYLQDYVILVLRVVEPSVKSFQFYVLPEMSNK